MEEHIQGHKASNWKTKPQPSGRPNPSLTRQQFNATDNERRRWGAERLMRLWISSQLCSYLNSTSWVLSGTTLPTPHSFPPLSSTMCTLQGSAWIIPTPTPKDKSATS